MVLPKISFRKKHGINNLKYHDPIAGAVGDNLVVIDPTTKLPVKDSGTSLASILGGINIQGSWDANTNTPTLASGVGVAGNGYIVGVAGSTNLDGITDWKIKDIAWFDGVASVWRKIDNTEDGTVKINADDTTRGDLDSKLYTDHGILKTIVPSSGVNPKQIEISPTYGTTTDTFCEGDDARLSDARVPLTHKDSHDPEDGSDPLDTATPNSINENANAEGSAHEFARSDHNHQHLAALHENGGGAEINVAALSGLLADDQHVLDSEVRAAVQYQADVTLAGVAPVDADVAGWAADDRGQGIGTGGREFYMVKRGTSVKYVELS